MAPKGLGAADQWEDWITGGERGQQEAIDVAGKSSVNNTERSFYFWKLKARKCKWAELGNSRETAKLSVLCQGSVCLNITASLHRSVTWSQLRDLFGETWLIWGRRRRRLQLFRNSKLQLTPSLSLAELRFVNRGVAMNLQRESKGVFFYRPEQVTLVLSCR